MEGLDIAVIAPYVIPTGTLVGIFVTFYKFYQEKQRENNRRMVELIISSTKNVNTSLLDLVNVTDKNILFRKCSMALDALDNLVYLASSDAVLRDVSEYFAYDAIICEKILQWMEKEMPVKEHPDYYKNRWKDIIDWLNKHDPDRKIPLNQLDLPEIMRDK